MKAPLLKELQWQNADLQEQVNELRNNSLLGQAQGENITLNDSADVRFSKIGISGNSYQDTKSTANGDEYDSPSLNNPSEIQTAGNGGSVNLVDCNKNFFDKNVTVELGTIGGGGNFSESTIRVRAYNIFVKSERKYTISSSNSDLFVVTYYYDKNNNFISYDDGWRNLPFTFTTPKNTEILKLLFKNSSDTITVSNVENIQIEEREVATDYVKHEEQTISIPVQQEMLEDDYFDFDNEKETHNWGKYIFTGTESEINVIEDIGNGFYSIQFNKNLNGKTNGKCLSNAYLFSLGSGATEHIRLSGSGRIIFYTSYANTIDEFKAKLQELYNTGTPVVAYYQLAEPLQLDFTDAQKQAKKELEKLKSYKNITHIYSTDEISPIVNLSYVKDTETYLNNLETRIEELEVN